MLLPPIHIDTMSLSEDFDLDRNDIDQLKAAVVDTATTVVYSAWRDQAKQNLHSSRRQYMESIVVNKVDKFTNIISLVGTLPNMIENGMTSFDMKKGFENSDKKTITRNRDGVLGWYLTIPFTWAQPGSLGESQKFSGVLPKEVSQILKSKPGITIKSKDLSSGLSAKSSRKEFKTPSGLEPEYKHKSSIYEGIHKSGGQVMSFRRVSSNSDESSWIHKGIPAHNLAEKALEDSQLDIIVGDVIDSFLQQKLG